MDVKLVFEYFPDLKILWPVNSDIPDKGQRRDSCSTERRFCGQENEIQLSDLCASRKSLHVIFYWYCLDLSIPVSVQDHRNCEDGIMYWCGLCHLQMCYILWIWLRKVPFFLPPPFQINSSWQGNTGIHSPLSFLCLVTEPICMQNHTYTNQDYNADVTLLCASSLLLI